VSEDGSPRNRPPTAGWYPDPAGGPNFRWWDGAAWTSGVRGPFNAQLLAPARSANERWRAWFFSSAPAVQVSRAVMVAAGVGIVIAATIVLLTLVRARPLPGLVLLLVPAIPALLVGQLWTIGVLNAHIPRDPYGWRQLAANTFRSWKRMRQVVLGTLPAWAAYAVMTLGVLGWLAAMTAFPALWLGGTNGGTPGCPYQLSNHGSLSCVSLTTYQHVGAAEQRLAAGVLLFFFAIHFAVARSELVRRREVAG
jgi:hypothetical protein